MKRRTADPALNAFKDPLLSHTNVKVERGKGCGYRYMEAHGGITLVVKAI